MPWKDLVVARLIARVLRLEVDGIDFGDKERISAIEERVPEASFEALCAVRSAPSQ